MELTDAERPGYVGREGTGVRAAEGLRQWQRDKVQGDIAAEKRVEWEKAQCELGPQVGPTYGGIAGGRSQSVAVEKEREELRAAAAYEHMTEAKMKAPWMSEVTEVPFHKLRPTMAEEAFKKAVYHADVANKALSAAEFFRANPAFEEFIRLIRSGAIQL